MKVKLLFIFSLLLTAVTGARADDSGPCGTDVSYSYVESTHTLTISGTGAMADYDDPYERPWNSYVEEIETVIIEDGVTRIGNRAFYDCSGLTTVTIPASVTTIGDEAFFNCSGLTAVTILSSVTSIGIGVFQNCSNLSTMTVEAGNKVYDSRNSCNAIIEKETNILIAGCKNTIIPDDVTTICDVAFVGCTSLTTITIPDGVTSIGPRAFSGCGLTSIEIPASVTSIGYAAFAGCSNLATMTVDAGNTKYDSRNGCNAIIEKESNTLIAGCKNTIIPDDVTNIDNYAFEGCTSLTSVTIPDGVTSIGDVAFVGCTSLTTVTIPDGVTSIGNRAFEGCSGLTTVTIGNGVTYIGYDAFYDCTKVEIVYCNANPEELMWDESGCDDFKPDGTTIIKVADAAPWIAKFTGVVNGTFGDKSYVPLTWNYDAGTKTLTFSGSAPIPSYNDLDDRPWKDYVKVVEKIVISDGVTRIGDDAFGYCASLTTVTIPASVKSIGSYAFEDCYSLTTITIPASVTNIGHSAFYACESLTSVIVHAPNCALGDCAFDECDNLEAIYVPSDKVEYYKAAEYWSTYADKITAFIGGDCGAEGHETDVTWLLKGTSPNYTLTISGTGAMADYDAPSGQPWKDYRSSITSVVIESGVTSIGKNAFNNCTGLTSATVDAPDCTLGNGAFEGCNLKAIYVPSDLVDHYKTKTAWSAYASIITEKIISQGYCGAEGHEEDVTWVLKNTSHNYTLTISGTGAMADYDNPSERPWYRYANGIETIVIEDGVTSIGVDAFFNCSRLTAVTIPASVTSIGNYAFNYCSNIATMTVEAGNKVYDSRNSCNAIIEKECNTLIAGCKNTIIPDDVTNINNNAFEGCISLTTVTIPASVTSIGDFAFYDCTGLTTVTIGSGVTYIGYDAFFNCTAVTDIYCYADPDALTWDEYGCNDFMYDGSTECHVTDATKFEEKWSTGDYDVDVNVTFVGDLAPKAETKDAGEEYWSSYYNSATHLKADNNTTVYKATLSGTTVTLTEITDKVITAGQAVLLKKTTADPVELTPFAAASTDDYSGNDLEGVDAETAKESDSDYYVLSYQDSKLSFYKYSGTTLGANKAFFKIPANSSREFLDILGEVTGIDGRCKMEDGRSDVYYDLNGRRVMNPTKKGVYINNGHKVVVK